MLSDTALGLPSACGALLFFCVCKVFARNSHRGSCEKLSDVVACACMCACVCVSECVRLSASLACGFMKNWTIRAWGQKFVVYDVARCAATIFRVVLMRRGLWMPCG